MANISLKFTNKKGRICLCATVVGTSIRHYRTVDELRNPDLKTWDKSARRFNSRRVIDGENNQIPSVILRLKLFWISLLFILSAFYCCLIDQSRQNNANHSYSGSSSHSHNSTERYVVDVEQAPFYNGYSETTTYSDGSQMIVNYLPSKNCNTNKVCPFCHGSGSYITPGYGQIIPCAACNRTGICAGCNENGYYISTSSSTSFFKNPNGQIYSGNKGDFQEVTIHKIPISLNQKSQVIVPIALKVWL